MPVFLVALWGLVNGGLLLYSINAANHSGSIGGDSIAASGNDPNADILGIQRMSAAGLGTTLLTSVSEIDVEELENNTALGGFCVYGASGCPASGGTNGSPVIQTGCTGAKGAFTGTGDCVDRYTFSGSTVTALDATCSSSVDVSQCPPWAPESRNVTNDASGESAEGAGASYVALVVHFSYKYIGGPSGGITLTSTTTFRVEPRT